MKNMKLSVKLIGAFLIISLITLIVGAVGTVKIKSIDNEAAKIYELNTKPLGDIYHAAAIFQKSRELVREVIIDKYLFGNDINELITKLNAFDTEISTSLGRFDGSIHTPEIRKEFDHLKAELGIYISLREKLIALIAEDKKDEAFKFMKTDVAIQADTIQAVIENLVSMNIGLAKTISDNNTVTANTAIWFAWIMTGIGFIASVGFGLFLTLSIVRPLNRIITGIGEGTDQVAAASFQIASSSQSLAEGASEQAASVEETSSSAEELSAMTKQNADNARQARSLMDQAGEIWLAANKQMKLMVEAIREISQSSQETSKIIKTIDEIAFQTNLLALNAAVEAARAGEAGAGFAVVADEVRNLAMRSAEAAKRTNVLIENTVNAVQKGNDTVKATREAFNQNIAIGKKLGDLVSEIEAATNEQASGIEQISRAVNEMNKVVQNNASISEESASASEEMNAQAENIKSFVYELDRVIGESESGGAKPQSAAIKKRLPDAEHKALIAS